MRSARFVYRMAVLFILWESIDGLSTTEQRNYVRLFGRALRRVSQYKTEASLMKKGVSSIIVR